MKKLTILVLLTMTTPLMSHHSTAGAFDIQKSVVVEGVIKSMDVVNPHVLLYLETTDAEGKGKTVAVEGLAPMGFQRTVGLKDRLKVGTRITVTGYPLRVASYAPKNITDRAATMIEGGEIKFAEGDVMAYGRGPAFAKSKA